MCWQVVLTAGLTRQSEARAARDLKTSSWNGREADKNKEDPGYEETRGHSTRQKYAVELAVIAWLLTALCSVCICAL
jgi:hypothetical protein